MTDAFGRLSDAERHKEWQDVMNAMDAIVHKLGIEDSHTSPCEAIDDLIKDRDHWKALAQKVSPSHDILSKSEAP